QLSGARPLARSGRLQLPRVEPVRRGGADAGADRGHAAASGRAAWARGRGTRLAAAGAQLHRFSDQGGRTCRAGRRLCRLQPKARRLGRISGRRGAGRHRRTGRGGGPNWSASSLDLAWLRLRRHHRRVSRPAASGRHPVREPADGAALPRWRGRADQAWSSGCRDRGVSGHAAVLPAGRGGSDPLSRRLARARIRQGLMSELDALVVILAATLRAGTPLVFAALGELIVEKSGVLNLGLEGMMLTGAVVGFIVAASGGGAVLGLLAAMLAGVALSLVFGFLVLTLR